MTEADRPPSPKQLLNTTGRPRHDGEQYHIYSLCSTMQSERRGSGMTTERLAGVEADMTKRISSAWPYMGAAAGTMLACGMILAAGETIFSVTFDSQSNRSLFRNKSRSAFAQHDPAHRAAEDTQAQLWFEQTRHAEQIRSYDGLNCMHGVSMRTRPRHCPIPMPFACMATPEVPRRWHLGHTITPISA